MSRITVLPPGLRNKIAAGEVIERPASVVKELIENSLDAGSTDIRIEVTYGGKRLIRVSDNGSGMDREDALLCFERHATSKLAKEEDLFNIRTLGFRGEALPSIASVSKVKLVTGEKGAVSGVLLEIAGGDMKETRESPFSGTDIEVRDLFFNVPARKKFLKTDGTELFHVIDTVTKEALSHDSVAFSLVADNRETMILPGASGARERIVQLYGDEFAGGLIEIKGEEADMKFFAFASKTDNFRNGRDHQFLFINGRPVKDSSVSHAVYRAYEGILPKEKHPVFFLFFEMNPGKVDFNVHPAKREVRFADKESIYRFIHGGMREAVKGQRTEFAREFTEMPPAAAAAPSSFPAYPSSGPGFEAAFVSEGATPSFRPSLPFIYLGDTFIALSGKGGLTLIDHHAAHERILYERFLKSIDLDSHRLLFPMQVKLSHKEYVAVLENRELLYGFGIEIDDFGHDTVIVRSLPHPIDNSDIRGIMADIASSVIEGAVPSKSLKEAVAARIACHNSVRGSEILNAEELSRLLSDLEKTDFPDQCPHGRPTRIFYSLDDLKKIFKRK